MQGMILRAQGGLFWVLTDGGVLECVLRGRLRQQQADDIAVIGDQVEVERLADGRGAIVAVLPRERSLSRRRPDGHDGLRGGHVREDVLVANIQQLLVVFAVDQPRPSPRMIDRFLVVAEQSGLAVTLVANKADLATAHEREAIFGLYERIGYPVLYTSIYQPAIVAALRAQLAGRISALVGPSGVGKSSLLNAVQPGLALRTSAVSAALNKGRHTTVVAELLALEGGGYVADTPGIRELGLWRLPGDELAWCFRELRPLLGGCAFASCSHLHEPGCALRAAVERGEVAVERYESYARLRQEEGGEARRRGDGDAEAKRRGGGEARRRGDAETGRRGGEETRGRGAESWDEWEEAGFAPIRSRKGHALKEAAQRAAFRETGRMYKRIMEEKRRRNG